jgi:Flp pilus assembly secretin CpaC
VYKVIAMHQRRRSLNVPSPFRFIFCKGCLSSESFMTGSFVLRVLKSACVTVVVCASPALAETGGISVTMNQAKIVKLSRDADTIVLGNPLIADAAVKDPRTIVITGKGFGVTNFVVLDNTGNPIVDEQVVVSRSVAETVRVYRRAKVQTLSCTPYCESSYKSEAEIRAELETAAANN